MPGWPGWRGEPTHYLAAVQIGSIVAGFFAAAFASAALVEPLAGPLTSAGVPAEAAEGVAVLIITLVVTFVALVIAELTPRRYAMQRAESVAMALGPILDRLATALRPLIWLLSKATNGVLRLLRANPAAAGEDISVEELRELVMSHEGLAEQERRIVRDVFAAADRHVRDAMLPRVDVDVLEASLPIAEAVVEAWKHAHTRYPVVDGAPDRVIGFAHIRELLDPAHQGTARTVRDITRDIRVLPATKALLPALSEMQAAGAHMAMVVDEYGGITGVVTVENLVEKLVGDIYDEYDTVPAPHPEDDGAGNFDGLMSLGEFGRRTTVALPPGPYHTVGGLIVTVLGRTPETGDTVQVAGHQLVVTSVRGWRVERFQWGTAELG